MNTTETDAMTAFGFEKVEGRDIWFFRRKFDFHPEMIRYAGERQSMIAAVIVTRDADGMFVGHVPYAGDPSTQDGFNELPAGSLFYRGDASDMVMLAQNEVASAYSETTGLFLGGDSAFEHDGMHITMPFMNDAYFNYGMVSRESDLYEPGLLRDPSEAYGNVYVVWREDFCAGLVAGSIPTL